MFLIEVEDSGIGIPPEEIGRLFVEFQQLDAGMAKKHSGTGLGLSLTRSIVEAQGGKVGVHSVPGQGSTFFASLPRVNKAIGEFAEQVGEGDRKYPAASLTQEGAPTVLVIEDDTRDRARLVGLLMGAGYAIETASTAVVAMERCQQRAFAAITLDLLLANASGWDVLHKMRVGGPNRETPVIVISLMKEKQLAMGFPISGYLSKPVQLEELLVALKRAMADTTLTNVLNRDHITSTGPETR